MTLMVGVEKRVVSVNFDKATENFELVGLPTDGLCLAAGVVFLHKPP